MWRCKASDPSHQAIDLAMTLLVWAKNPHIGTMRQDIARRSMLEPGRFEFIEFLEEGLDQLIGEEPPSSDFYRRIKMDKRRLKRVAVSLELYTDFITTGSEIHARCVAGLPEDAVFAGSAFDPASMAVYLFYHHESFDEVGEAENVPVFMPEFQTVPLDTRDNPDHAAVKIASFFDWVYAQNLAKTLTEEADWRKARFEEELNALKEEAASEQEPEEDSAED